MMVHQFLLGNHSHCASREKPHHDHYIIVRFSSKKFDMVDVQNATLSGGIAVGAMADLMIQPYGAFIAGTFTGTISCLGYRVLQVTHFKKKP